MKKLMSVVVWSLLLGGLACLVFACSMINEPTLRWSMLGIVCLFAAWVFGMIFLEA